MIGAFVCSLRRRSRLPPLASQDALPHFTLRLTVLPAVYCSAQQMAEPSSSAHFVSYAVAFYIATYGSACSFAAARNRWQSHLPSLASQATLSHFSLQLKLRKMRGTYTEIARLQPDCNFSVKPRKIRNRRQSRLPPPAPRATLSHFTLRLKPRKMRNRRWGSIWYLLFLKK